MEEEAETEALETLNGGGFTARLSGLGDAVTPAMCILSHLALMPQFPAVTTPAPVSSSLAS